MRELHWRIVILKSNTGISVLPAELLVMRCVTGQGAEATRPPLDSQASSCGLAIIRIWSGF